VTRVRARVESAAKDAALVVALAVLYPGPGSVLVFAGPATWSQRWAERVTRRAARLGRRVLVAAVPDDGPPRVRRERSMLVDEDLGYVDQAGDRVVFTGVPT